MKRDPEKHRAWQERSRKKAAEKARSEPRTPLQQKTAIRKIRPDRARAKKEAAFAAQAALCRGLPCCACWAHLYEPGLPALEHYDPIGRPSDPHHSPTVAAGGLDKDTVPLCRWHHNRLDSPGHSERSVQEECGIDFRAVADMLHRYLQPTG